MANPGHRGIERYGGIGECNKPSSNEVIRTNPQVVAGTAYNKNVDLVAANTNQKL